MDIEVLIPEGGPRLGLPFSPGIKFGDLIFVSGQVPFDEKGNIVGQGDVKRQTEQTLRNLEAVLKAGGSMLDDVLKVTVYLKEISQFAAMNDVYRQFFRGRLPARTTIQARLAFEEMLIEIEAIARVAK